MPIWSSPPLRHCSAAVRTYTSAMMPVRPPEGVWFAIGHAHHGLPPAPRPAVWSYELMTGDFPSGFCVPSVKRFG